MTKEWERLAGASPTKKSAESSARYWREFGYKTRLHKEVDKLPRFRRNKRGELVPTKRKGFLWYIELKRPYEGFIPSRDSRRRRI